MKGEWIPAKIPANAFQILSHLQIFSWKLIGGPEAWKPPQ